MLHPSYCDSQLSFFVLPPAMRRDPAEPKWPKSIAVSQSASVCFSLFPERLHVDGSVNTCSVRTMETHAKPGCLPDILIKTWDICWRIITNTSWEVVLFGYEYFWTAGVIWAETLEVKMAPNITFQRTFGVMTVYIAWSRPTTVCCDINLYVAMFIVFLFWNWWLVVSISWYCMCVLFNYLLQGLVYVAVT